MPACHRCGRMQASAEVRRTTKGHVCKDKPACQLRRERTSGGVLRAVAVALLALTGLLVLVPEGDARSPRPPYRCGQLRDVDRAAWLDCRVDYYAAWVRAERRRNRRLKRKLDRTWPGRERDHSRAIAVAGATFPAPSAASTRSWLDGCARSEGARGPWVWNGGVMLSALERIRMAALERRGVDTLAYRPAGSSGAGGWWQFLRSTFYANVEAAFQAAFERGVVVPRRYRNWYSRVDRKSVV